MKNMQNFLAEQPKVSRHAANTAGRDFIVGDLHGCRSMLDALLAQVQFDTETDRLFAVGDLIDRGDDSQACLDLLREPWFFSALGGHEAMLLAYWSPLVSDDAKQCQYRGAFHQTAGTSWVRQISESEKQDYLALLKNLPFVHVVGAEKDRFQVFHAERCDNDSLDFLADADLDDPQDSTWAKPRWIDGFGSDGSWHDHLLWGRSRITGEPPFAFKQIRSRDYTGHTPTLDPRYPQSVVQLGQQMCLDTAAYAAKAETPFGLTLWNAQENRGWRVLGDGKIVACSPFLV
jgi:serine/threonine protein phosphatase 1